MRTRTFLLLSLLALPAAAEWRRHVMTPKASWFDKAEPHPLKYFTEHPMLRDESGDFCYLCTPQKRLAEAKKHKVSSEIRFVGAIQGFEVYDLYYRSKCEGCSDPKSILVKTGPDQYREIYHVEPTQVDARAVPSFIVSIGPQRLLGCRYVVGGNKGMYSDDYYWFDTTGPVLVDFEPVYAAARAGLPNGKTLWEGGDENGPRTMALGMFTFWVQDRGDWLCCSHGAVIVRFRLDGGRVVVTQTKFDPNGGPKDPTRKQ